MHRQHIEQHRTNSPLQKKVRFKKLHVKTMVNVFFDADRITYSKFVHEGTTVNSHYYLEVMERMHACMRHVSNGQFHSNSWLLMHDNAPTHCTLNVKQFLASKSICVIQHHPYLPDMALALFSLPKGETGPKWTAFQ
jgi:hypothetical protein